MLSDRGSTHCKLSSLIPGVALFMVLSCTPPKSSNTDTEESLEETELPYRQLPLKDLSSFQETLGNWKIVGDVQANLDEERSLTTTPGKGVIVNNFSEEDEEGLGEDFEWERFHLFTSMEHGDIDLELEVMMPVGSNSGIYFQGRYEIQLLDSWGVEDPGNGDMGGIYERWDDSRDDEEAGYEGRAPRINAAKAPGLWQHFNIKFRAPRFDQEGQKIALAKFEEVWLNGVLLHEHEEVSGPTRAAPFNDEKPLGPIMFQGDHGPVAFKNIRYKTYGNAKVTYQDLMVKQFESNGIALAHPDTLEAIRTLAMDSLTAAVVEENGTEKLLLYQGKLNIPASGDYLFELRFMGGGGLLQVDETPVLFMDEVNWPENSGRGKVTLAEGLVPFRFIYNQPFDDDRGFSIAVEGPGIAWQTLSAPGSLVIDWEDEEEQPYDPIVIRTSNSPVMQRSFLMHEGTKRTHVVSVSTPEGIHFAYDLLYGSLLKTWEGDFLDVTAMWYERGEAQLAKPLGAPIVIHGDPDFAVLAGEHEVWPDTISLATHYRSMGYEIREDGNPQFFHEIQGSTVNNHFEVSNSPRSLTRHINTNGKETIWHKVGGGSSVEKLPDGTYAIDDKRYYVKLEPDNPQAVIRKNGNQQELLLKIPAGPQQLNYDIIW